MQSLPTLKQTLVNALLSITKNKNAFKTTYTHNQSYTLTSIDSANLEAYKTYFGFTNDFPLPYFYLLAQRAQLGLMVDKTFPLPVIGMVHLENTITTLGTFNPSQALTFTAKVTIEAKPGSIAPLFEVTISQNNQPVFYCSSLYLAKRKNPNKPTEAKVPQAEPIAPAVFDYTELWDIPASFGRSYANLSGDHNPIHTHTLFAKLTGFKSTIIHGWYSVSRAVAAWQKAHNTSAKSITVSFKKPILLPSKATLYLQGSSYSLFSPNGKLQHLEGVIE